MLILNLINKIMHKYTKIINTIIMHDTMINSSAGINIENYIIRIRFVPL